MWLRARSLTLPSPSLTWQAVCHVTQNGAHFRTENQCFPSLVGLSLRRSLRPWLPPPLPPPHRSCLSSVVQKELNYKRGGTRAADGRTRTLRRRREEAAASELLSSRLKTERQNRVSSVSQTERSSFISENEAIVVLSTLGSHREIL